MRDQIRLSDEEEKLIENYMGQKTVTFPKNPGDTKGRPNGKPVITDTRELRLEKIALKKQLKILFNAKHLNLAPQYKLTEAKADLLSDKEEQAELLEKMAELRAEYEDRKVRLNAATNCDEASEAVYA